MCKGGKPGPRRGTDRPHAGSCQEQEWPPAHLKCLIYNWLPDPQRQPEQSVRSLPQKTCPAPTAPGPRALPIAT